MSVLDTLKKQAAAVVDGPKAAKVADLLRQAAALLEEAQPKKESFAIVKQRNIDARAARLGKFGDSIRKNKVEDRERMLLEAGWVQFFRNEAKGEYSYGTKAKPGVHIKIVADKFSVVHGPAVLQDK